MQPPRIGLKIVFRMAVVAAVGGLLTAFELATSAQAEPSAAAESNEGRP